MAVIIIKGLIEQLNAAFKQKDYLCTCNWNLQIYALFKANKYFPNSSIFRSPVFYYNKRLFITKEDGLCKLDIAFALDNSGSVTKSNFEDQKTFAQRFMQLFRPSAIGTRTSMITFSTDAKIEWNINSREGKNCNLAIKKLKDVPKLHSRYF